MLKAIETHYAGYRFRSRLEARWAVFFDTLGVKYQYEPQGFQLGTMRYLPDFWLPHEQAWVEIKGELPTGSDAEKWHRFVDACRRHNSEREEGETPRDWIADLWMIVGEPYFSDEPHYDINPLGRHKSVGAMYFQRCLLCARLLDVMWSPKYPDTYQNCPACDVWDRNTGENEDGYFHKGLVLPQDRLLEDPRFSLACPPDLRRAYDTARSARFEHGDTPASNQQPSRPLPRTPTRSMTQVAKPKLAFEAGDRVKHPKFGAGIVVSCRPSGDDQLIEIAFKEGVGIRKLMLSFGNLQSANTVRGR